jgi:hypothetical protein
MSEDELQKVIALCGGVFLPVGPDVHARVAPRLDNKLLDPHGPIVTPEEIEAMVPDDIEAQLVLKEINARKGAGGVFLSVESSFDEVTEGFSARVTRGHIGLISHESKATPTTPMPSAKFGKAKPFYLSRSLLLLVVVILALLFGKYSTFVVA